MKNHLEYMLAGSIIASKEAAKREWKVAYSTFKMQSHPTAEKDGVELAGFAKPHTGYDPLTKRELPFERQPTDGMNAQDELVRFGWSLYIGAPAVVGVLTSAVGDYPAGTVAMHVQPDADTELLMVRVN